MLTAEMTASHFPLMFFQILPPLTGALPQTAVPAAAKTAAAVPEAAATAASFRFAAIQDPQAHRVPWAPEVYPVPRVFPGQPALWAPRDM